MGMSVKEKPKDSAPEEKEKVADTSDVKEKEDKGSEQAPKEPGFFSRSWTKVKTGASWLTKKVSKAVSKDPDEMSDDEFDAHLQEREASGEESATGYASRYYQLLEELKTMPSLMTLSKQSEKTDIAEAVSENENLDAADKEENEAAKEKGTDTSNETEAPKAASEPIKEEPKTTEEESAKSEPSKSESEPEEAEPEAEAEKEEAEKEEAEKEEAEKEEATTEEASQDSSKTEKETEGEEETTLDKIKDFQEDGIGIAKGGMSIYKNRNKAKALEKLSGEVDPNSTEGRQVQYMQAQAKKETATSGFDLAQNAVNTADKLIQKFGSESVKSIAGKIISFVNMGLGYGKDLITKRMDKKSVKNGLKGLLGGTDVYKKLKDKYKLHAGDMRRAIRVAANRSSTQELVDADKDKLSEDYAQKTEAGSEDVSKFMGLAGGRDAESIKKAMGRVAE